MTQALDKLHAMVYINTNELTVKERQLLNLVRSVDKGSIICYKDKGVITHFERKDIIPA